MAPEATGRDGEKSSSGNLSDGAELPLTRTLIKAKKVLAILSHIKLGRGRIQLEEPRGDGPSLGRIRRAARVTATEAVVKST